MTLQKIRCKFCALTASLLDNPYQYSGQIITKLAVNGATAIWAFVVLIKSDALTTWPGSFILSGVVHENALAVALLILSAIATVRLFYKRSPIPLGACAYGLFLLLWLYTLATLLVAVHLGITALRPGQLAGVVVVTALSAFAFVSNPKRRRDGSPSD